jgi:hypothetical protein
VRASTALPGAGGASGGAAGLRGLTVAGAGAAARLPTAGNPAVRAGAGLRSTTASSGSGKRDRRGVELISVAAQEQGEKAGKTRRDSRLQRGSTHGARGNRE